MNLLRLAEKTAVRIAHRVSAPHRRFVLRRSLKQVAHSSANCELPSPIVNDLIYGWGNHPWSAKPEFIQAMVQAAWQAKAPILECGSGLSTLLLGLVAGRTGQRVWTLEHNAAWANKLQKALVRHKIYSVEICLAELRDYRSYVWYAAPKDRMPTNFSLVVCDGPPGNTRGGRYGLIPQMRTHLHAGCVILLDDASRPAEQELLKRWSHELGSSCMISGSSKPFGRLVVAA